MPLSKREEYHKEPSPPPTQSPVTSPKYKSSHAQTLNHDAHRSLSTNSRPQQDQVDSVQDDEIQLVKVSNNSTAANKQDYPNQQRNDYISRVYQKSPTRVASSPRVFQSTTDHSSWQEDASTEPITPMIEKGTGNQEPSSPTYHTSKRRTVIKTLGTANSPIRGNTTNNPIDLLASTSPRSTTKLSLSKSKKKRKVDEIDLTSSPITTTTKQIRVELEEEKALVTPTPTTTTKEQSSALKDSKSHQQESTPVNRSASPKMNVNNLVHAENQEIHLKKQNITPLPTTTNTVKNNEAAAATTTITTMRPPVPNQSTSTSIASTAVAPTTSTEERNKKLTKEEEATKVHEEIDYLMKTVKCLPNYYKLVDKIGEGTFSTVYKALDIRREFYNNDDWEPPLLNSPTLSDTPSPSQSPTSSQKEPQPTIPTARRGKNNNKTSNQYVALKRIYHTSSPRRIATEIGILRKLRGSPCISPLITAFRQQDQVFVVMPYIQHDDFKTKFYHFSITDIKHYLRSLFTALMHLHKHHILHRDVKPNNFLYNIRKKTGYLIDFGLAEHEKDGQILEAYAAKLETKTQGNIFVKSSREAAMAASGSSGPASTSVLIAMTNKENCTSSQSSITAAATATEDTNDSQQQQQKRIAGYVKNDARHQVRANRAGTRGFRAPEILMRVTRQTCAIDIWAAGVIFLCFLSGRYPFFLANDEADSIVELCQIYGYNEMKKCAENYNRNFDTNLFIPTHKAPLSKLCEHLNKEKVATWDRNEYLQGIDLLEKCMDLNNKTRMTAAQALDHPFLIFQDESSK